MPWGIDYVTGAPVFLPAKGDPGDPGGDAHFFDTFTNESSVTVTHNLGKKPAVTILDTAGDEVVGEINHVSINELTIDFSASFSGSVILN